LPGKICLGCGYDPSKPAVRPRAKSGPPPPRPFSAQSFRNPARSEKKAKSKLREKAPAPADIIDEFEAEESADARPAKPLPAPAAPSSFSPPPISQRAQLPDETVQVTTQPAFEGHRIMAYKGLVVSSIAIRVGEQSELWSEGQDIRRLSGGPLGLRLRKAIDVAVADLKMEAMDRGANAVLGLHLEFLPVHGNLVILTAMGTAVTLES
jgi:uncharacterized protein YbjQ (UPF0145 family)